MKPIEKEGNVPAGRVRRIAIVFEAKCFQCPHSESLVAVGAGACPAILRSRGWSHKSKRWHCPVCSGNHVSQTSFRIGDHR